MSECKHVALVAWPFCRRVMHSMFVQYSFATCFMAPSSAFAENAPLGDAGRIDVRFGVKACWATPLYARIHSSVVIPNLPSIIAMILVNKLSKNNPGAWNMHSYPPVLVPPMMSKYSHGRGTWSRHFASRIFSIILSKIRRLEIPRIPPPSPNMSVTEGG